MNDDLEAAQVRLDPAQLPLVDGVLDFGDQAPGAVGDEFGRVRVDVHFVDVHYQHAELGGQAALRPSETGVQNLHLERWREGVLWHWLGRFPGEYVLERHEAVGGLAS